MITKDKGFIYVCICTAEIHCIHCKGINMNKMLKIMKNNVTALKGLKNAYIMAHKSESESEAKITPQVNCSDLMHLM